MSERPVLEVRDLHVSVRQSGRELVSDVSLRVMPREIVGIVGESGSGKTLTMLALSQLLPAGLTATSQVLTFDGHDLTSGSPRRLRSVLASRMSMVFQDPLSSLNPARRVGSQMIESVRTHQGLSRSDARDLAIAALDDVGIDDPERRYRQYPHELSGGMRQRVMIAMGMLGDPVLFVADEPTTALDVSVQAQVMELLCRLNDAHGTAVLLVSHNISLLSEVCDRMIVMYRGRVVEELTVDELLAGPAHPYTQALLRAVPDLTMDRNRDLEVFDERPDEMEALDA
ncbi:ABC transporter ATP-binding protein [Janibacter melonis]|uniref:ABC transporter ATP-binding protein n=1 Tax=Janibacter melonis TaxID=262209 RepID=UPI001787746F|nr:ABC transporter ATP-binding protein [Janibacter melonis]